MRRSNTILVGLLALTTIAATTACSSDPGQSGADGFTFGADTQIDGGAKDADERMDAIPDAQTQQDTDEMTGEDTLADAAPDTTPPQDTNTPPDTPPADTPLPPDTSAPDTLSDTMTPAPDTPSFPADASLDRDALPAMHGPGSIIDQLNIKQSCCRDFDGDGSNDNALASLISTYANLPSTNQQINGSIQNGSLIVLFEYGKWSNLAMDSMIEMVSHPGQDATPGNDTDDFSGSGKYYIDPNSYYPNGKPKAKFSSAQVKSTRNLDASGKNLPMSIPLTMTQTINISLKDVKVTAKATAGSTTTAGGTVGLNAGQLSGAVTKADLFGSLNKVFANQCSCLGGNDIFEDPDGDDNYSCNNTALQGCSGGSGLARLCDPTFCGFGAQSLNNQADIDRDKSTMANDAYSFGSTFTAKGAQITGVAP